MEIKILGTGCPSCIRLEENVKMALEKAGKKADVEKIKDIADIMTYGVMGVPGLVIDNKVISSGKVNSIDEIVEMLNGGDSSDKGEDKGGCCCCGG